MAGSCSIGGKQLGGWNLGDDLAADDQIHQSRFRDDQGGRINAIDRVGVDLELAVDDVDDP
jgi:hypothetical protein